MVFVYFLIGLFVGADVIGIIWYCRHRAVSGLLLLDFYNDDAESVPISLELYIPIEEVRKKKTIQLDVYESR